MGAFVGKTGAERSVSPGVQRKNGFTQTEQEELDEAFHRFSDDTGVGYKDWILLSRSELARILIVG